MRSTPPASASELGWRPSVTLEEGLERTVRLVSRQRGLVARAAGPRRRRASGSGRGMTLLVFGQTGQVATRACRGRAPDADLSSGRAAADLSDPAACAAAIAGASARRGHQRRRLDRRRPGRGRRRPRRHCVNGEAPGAMARACAALRHPLRACLDRLRLRRHRARALARRTTRPRPLGAYGRTKLAGEDGGARGGRRACHPAHLLGVLGPWRRTSSRPCCGCRRPATR